MNMVGQHLHRAWRNIVCNRIHLAIRMVALTGALIAGSCIYLIRYALDYGGWLPNDKGIFPEIAFRSGGSLLIATMVLHVDIALWQCLWVSLTIFVGAALVVVARAMRGPPKIGQGR